MKSKTEIYFVGAGPGAPDLITLRALKVLQSCDCCLYAGSLVPRAILSHLPQHALKYDSVDMVLDEIVDKMINWVREGKKVVRLHSGDPSIYGAIFEQMQKLDQAKINYQIIPGVNAFSAAAACIKRELTLPDISQSVVITRVSVRSTSMSEYEKLENFAMTRATLAIHLSINSLAHIVRILTPYYGADCPCVIAYRVGWPDQMFLYGSLDHIRQQVKAHKITRTAIIFVGRVFADKPSNAQASKLYDSSHSHILRKRQ
ncbi:MAG: precorrin-4 C(11)-methyltransferase [Pseudomonadota bacterium]